MFRRTSARKSAPEAGYSAQDPGGIEAGVAKGAQEAAGVIHSDLEKHFIRAETIRWDELLDAGSEANARSKGTLRLEGKDYIVQDGDVMHIRHSG